MTFSSSFTFYVIIGIEENVRRTLRNQCKVRRQLRLVQALESRQHRCHGSVTVMHL